MGLKGCDCALGALSLVNPGTKLRRSKYSPVYINFCCFLQLEYIYLDIAALEKLVRICGSIT